MESSSGLNKKAYLERIGLGSTSPAVDLESLSLLQRSHLLSVPFENLDIHWSRPIVLDRDRFFEKVVDKGRGGFCYELNGLFESLLKLIGFRTRLISARVFNGKEHGPEFDHAAILVTLGSTEYLVDVGFGAFTAAPLPFTLDRDLEDANGTFLIRKREDDYFEVMKRESGIWRSEYMFRDVSYDLADFAEMCDFQQYAPESHFRKGKLCSIMTVDGRKTLTDKSFIITANASKNETPVVSEEQFYKILLEEFGIVSAQV